MITDPLPFQEALQYLIDKEDLPGEWDASMWAEQEADFRTQAFWSSRVENSRFLDRAHGFLFDYIAKTTEQVVGPDGVTRTALKMSGREHFVKRMRDFMITEGMADAGEFQSVNQNDVKDLRSLARLRLIFDTNVRQAYGYGQWKQGMTPAVLKAFPAARLIRERSVKEPRPRHQVNLGEINLKTSPRWAEYHNARDIGGFGVPWGPYGFGSGVTHEDVSKAEARAAGIDVDSARAPADDKRMTDGTTSSTKGMNPSLKEQLLAELRNGPKSVDPKEAAREAASVARREMLTRGLAGAEERGDQSMVQKYRKAFSNLPSRGLKVVDEGDSIRLE